MKKEAVQRATPTKKIMVCILFNFKLDILEA